MTDRLLSTLARLDDPQDGPGGAPSSADPARLADGALRRAGARTRTRRVATAVAVPLVAAAAVLAVSVVPGGLLAGLRTDGQAASPTTGPDGAPWGDAARVDVLLVGSDGAPERVGWRADTVVLASVDTRTGETLLVGVPRNRLGTVGPDGRFEIAPDARVAPIEPQVERLTGLKVDATLRLDMAGFARAVDALGGVDVTVQRRLPIGGVHADDGTTVQRPTAWIQPGRQHLDGYHALWFARSRFSTDDYDRMRRQRCLLGALADQVDGPRLLAAAPGLLRTLGTTLDTSVRLQDLPAWVTLLEKVRTARVRSVVLDLPLQAGGVPDEAASREAVRAALAAPVPTQAATSATTPATTSAGAASGAPGAQPARPGTAVDLTDVC